MPAARPQVSFLALYHLLDFGSGYDDLLLQKNKRDARETIQFGCACIVTQSYQ